MKIEVKKSDIVDILSNLKEVKEKFWFSGSIFLSAQKNKGIFMIFDDFSWHNDQDGIKMQIEVEGKVINEGYIEISNIQLVALIFVLYSQSRELINLKYKNENLILETSKTEYRFTTNTRNFESSNIVYKYPEDAMLKIDQAKFKKMLNYVDFACLNRNKLGYKAQNGVKVELLHKEVRLIATNYHHLAFYSTKLEKGSFLQSGVLPKRTVFLLGRLLNYKGELFISKYKDKVVFKSDKFTLISALIKDDFPYYEKIISNLDIKCKIEISKRELIRMLKHAELINDKFDPIIFDINNDTLFVRAKPNEDKKFSGEYQVNKQGEDVEVGFSPSYALELLNTIKEENIIIKFAEDEDPIIFESSSIPGYRYILMPIKEV